MVVVTGGSHAVAISRQLPGLREEGLLVEPAPRNSAAAIGLAAAVVAASDPDAVIGSFAADHVIADDEVFHAAVAEAVAAAREGWLVTIGIDPTGPGHRVRLRPRPGEPLDVAGAPSLRRVEEFVEKPDAATAARYVAGRLALERRHVRRPGGDPARDARRARARPRRRAAGHRRGVGRRPEREEVLAATWPGLASVPDRHRGRRAGRRGRAGGRRAGRVRLGRRRGLDLAGRPARRRPTSGGTPVGEQVDGLLVLGDASLVMGRHASGVVVPGSGRTVVVAGLEDVVVVDTLDAVLVTSREQAQDVKHVVDLLKSEGRSDLV